MSSTRLPGKVLRPLAGAPMVLRQVERIRRARRIDELVVAVSTDRTDDVLAEILEHNGLPVFRGPLHDVLARFSCALESHNAAKHVVPCRRLPLRRPGGDRRGDRAPLESGADYTSNTPERRTFPRGWTASDDGGRPARCPRRGALDDEREHVTHSLSPPRPLPHRRGNQDRARASALDGGPARPTTPSPAGLRRPLSGRSPSPPMTCAASCAAGPSFAKWAGDRRV